MKAWAVEITHREAGQPSTYEAGPFKSRKAANQAMPEVANALYPGYRHIRCRDGIDLWKTEPKGERLAEFVRAVQVEGVYSNE